MKHLIIMLAEVTSVIAFAATAEKPKNEPSPTAVMCVEKSSEDGKLTRAQWKSMTPEERTAAMKKMKAEKATSREKCEAKRLGYSLEDWCSMTKKARKDIRQEALAKEKGMTVAEMKAEANRKAAEKAGCPVEKWTAMTVKERIAFRKQSKGKEG